MAFLIQIRAPHPLMPLMPLMPLLRRHEGTDTPLALSATRRTWS
jgi:hypothetical protein